MKRRSFIKNATVATAIPSLFGTIGIRAFGTSPLLSILNNAYTDTDHVLVIVRMAGGNDGLNTVIPLDQYSNLSTARANILINENQVLKLNGVTATGLNPAMTGVQTLFNEGKVKIVQGVSYPNQSYSHFRATDIMMSASDSNAVVTSGWVGRYLNNEYPNYPAGFPNTTMPDPLGIQMNDMSLTFQGQTNLMGITISNPDNPYAFLTDPNQAALPPNMTKELSFLQVVANQADKYGTGVKAAYDKAANTVPYPASNQLSPQLSTIARMIKGGLKTRAYFVTISSFDTHVNQVMPSDHTMGDQATLLQQVSDAILAFQRDLEGLKIQDRVLTMTFSEFGRRIISNASGGTDHGSAYPMFIVGSQVKGGMLGVNPTIPANADVNANLVMQYDFRSVYGSLLKDWFCINTPELSAVMLGSAAGLQDLPLVNSQMCGGIVNDTHELNNAAGIKVISNYPNPFDFGTTIQFETQGGHTLVQIFDVEGQLIAVPVDGIYAPGKFNVYYNGGYLPSGVYYLRFQDSTYSQVRMMNKVR